MANLTQQFNMPEQNPHISPMYKRCRQCGDRKYIIGARNGIAEAKWCDCQIDSETKRFKCSECSGKGFLILEDNYGYEYNKPCQCRKQQKRLDRFNQTGIPLKFASVSIDSYVPSSERQGNARRYLEAFVKREEYTSQGFVLMGPCGIGKTHLLAAVLKTLTLERDVSCRFVDFFHLLQSIRNCYSSKIPESTLIDPLIEVDILAVDELGKGKRDSEWEQNVLDQIISRRYNLNKSTLFTTNYTLDQDSTYKGKEKIDNRRSRFIPQPQNDTLRDRIGERIYSRICEMCDFLLIDGDDFRKLSG